MRLLLRKPNLCEPYIRDYIIQQIRVPSCRLHRALVFFCPRKSKPYGTLSQSFFVGTKHWGSRMTVTHACSTIICCMWSLDVVGWSLREFSSAVSYFLITLLCRCFEHTSRESLVQRITNVGSISCPHPFTSASRAWCFYRNLLNGDT